MMSARAEGDASFTQYPTERGQEAMMAVKLACADFAFPLLSHDRALDLIAMLGFKAVDIGLFEGRSHLWPSRVYKTLDQSASDLARKLADRGLKPADIYLQTATDFTSLAPNHPDPSVRGKARELFLRTLEFSHTCGCRHVTALPGVYFDGEPKDEGLKRCREELAWRCEQAKKAKIVFGVEAHVGSIVAVPWDADNLVKSVPGLTLTLDYTHFIQEGFPDSTVEPLIRLASHFHARAARRGRLQASFKENVIDYARILDVLSANHYQGYIGVEYTWTEWEHCNEVDNLSETILMRDFLLSHAKAKPTKPANDGKPKAARAPDARKPKAVKKAKPAKRR
jgi:sugar phosphate isomerase/epimerase